MLDWLEYILSCVTAAEEGTEKLSAPLLPRSLVLPLKQVEGTYPTEAENPPSAAYSPLSVSLLQGRQTVLRDISEQTARRSGEQAVALPESALPLLYRRTEEAVSRTALAGLAGVSAAGQAQVITVQSGEPAPAGLTAHELDRAIRRDSRRFDGGMTIY